MSVLVHSSSDNNIFTLNNFRPSAVEFSSDDESSDSGYFIDTNITNTNNTNNTTANYSPSTHAHASKPRVRFQRPPPPSGEPPCLPRVSAEEIEAELSLLIGHSAASTRNALHRPAAVASRSPATAGAGVGVGVGAADADAATTSSPNVGRRVMQQASPLDAYFARAQAQPSQSSPMSSQASQSASVHSQSTTLPPSFDYATGGTIKLMQSVVSQKRQAHSGLKYQSGLPSHLDIASNCAAMALDVLALSQETQAMNDESLRGGIWSFVVPSLMMFRETETSKFIQIVQYLMRKDSSLMLRGLDFFMYLIGYYREWECKNAKEAAKQSYQWTREQRQRIWPNMVASMFEADVCEAIIVAARDFMREQSAIHLRLDGFSRAFDKTYKRSNGIPHWREENRKILKHAFRDALVYWGRKQRELRKQRS